MHLRLTVALGKGEVKSLVLEAETIQKRLASNKNLNAVELSRKFEKFITKGNLNGALKILNYIVNGILPLSDGTSSSSITSIQRNCHDGRYTYDSFSHIRRNR